MTPTRLVPQSSDMSPADAVARVAAWLAASVGVVVLIGWMFDVPALQSMIPGLPTVKANAALCFVATGAFLIEAARGSPSPRSRLVRSASAALVSAVGTLTLVEYMLGANLRIDNILFAASNHTALATSFVRMPPTTALLFALFGLAMVLTLKRGHAASQVLSAVIAAASLVTIVGYAYGVRSLYEIATFASMALPTAILLVVVSTGLISLHPDLGFARVVTSRGSAGIAARQLLPAIILLPVVLGGLILIGARSGLYGGDMTLALMAIGTMAIFATVVLSITTRLQRVDGEREQATAALTELNGDLEDRVHERTAALVASEAQFRAVADTAADCIISADESGHITYANQAVERVFGWSLDELLGQPLTVLIPEPMHAAHRDGLARYLVTGEAHVIGKTVELSAERKDGREFPIELSLASWSLKGRTFFTGMIRHIGVQRERDAEISRLVRDLQASEQRAFRFLGEVPVGVFVTNGEGTPVYANEAAIEILGAGVLSGARLNDLSTRYSAFVVGTNELYPVATLPVTQALQGHVTTVDDMEIRRSDGSVRLEVRGAPIVNDEGAVEYAITSFTDITAQKEAEDQVARRAEELARSNRDLEQFAYVASHDLQEPLRMVASYVALLATRYRDSLDDDAREFVDFAVDGATRMQALINDLLIFSRAGRSDAAFKPVAMGEVAERAAANMRSRIEESQATVTWVPCRRCPVT